MFNAEMLDHCFYESRPPKIFLFCFFIEVQLIYNIILVSEIQHSESTFSQIILFRVIMKYWLHFPAPYNIPLSLFYT